MSRFLTATALLGTVAVGPTCTTGSDSGRAGAEVAAVLESYRQAWLAGDADAVMAHMSDSVILYVPGRGSSPVAGKTAVRAHYFPAADTTYPITRYEISAQRIHVGGDLAVVEGRSLLGWNTTVANRTLDSATAESEYITVMARQDGHWLVYRQMYVIR